MNALAVRSVDGGLELRVRVAPGARSERVLGVHGGALKLAVQAPPERGRANDRVLDLLAALLGVPRRAVALVSGATARDKVVRIAGLDDPTLRARLAAAEAR